LSAATLVRLSLAWAAPHPNPAPPCPPQVRTLVQRDMEGALSRFDLLLSPAAPTPAYRIGEKSSDPLEMYKGVCAPRGEGGGTKLEPAPGSRLLRLAATPVSSWWTAERSVHRPHPTPPQP
jgi:hypothetical protein